MGSAVPSSTQQGGDDVTAVSIDGDGDNLVVGQEVDAEEEGNIIGGSFSCDYLGKFSTIVTHDGGDDDNNDNIDNDSFFTANDTSTLGDADNGDDNDGNDNDELNQNNGTTQQPQQLYSERHVIVTVSELRKNTALLRSLERSQAHCLALWKDEAEPMMKNDTLLGIMDRATTFIEQNLNKGSGSNVNNNDDSGSGGGRNDGNWHTNHCPRWKKREMNSYHALVEWRDRVAAEIGTMPGRVCNLDLLALVAYRRPTSVDGLRRLCYFAPDVLVDDDDCYSGDDKVVVLVKEDVSYLEQMFEATAATGDENEGHDEVLVTYLYDEVANDNDDDGDGDGDGDADADGNEYDDDDDDNGGNESINGNRDIVTGATFQLNHLKWTAIAASIAAFWFGVYGNGMTRRR